MAQIGKHIGGDCCGVFSAVAVCFNGCSGAQNALGSYLVFFVHGFGSCSRDNSRTCPPVTGQALTLSSCCNWDNPAGDAVGLLGFGAMGAKPDDLAAVGALA